MNSREVIKRLREDGWELSRIRGDHHQFKHPEKPGLVTVVHPDKDLSRFMIKSIEKQAGIKLTPLKRKGLGNPSRPAS